MGQTIEILKTTVIDRVLVVDTDRTLAGQDGEAYSGAPRTDAASTFPARLAERIFEEDRSVDNVFVMSNTVSVRRAEEWTDDTVAAVARVVAEFFRFYPDRDEMSSPPEAESTQPAQPAEQPPAG